MSDHDGGTGVDSSNADYNDSENDDIRDAAGTEPLSFAGVMFWIFVGFLGLLGVCVIVTIILALVKGS